MAVKIYDASAGAFKDAPTPQIYDASTQAYKDSTGLVYDTSKSAWEERWGGLANGVLYDRGKENKKYYESIDLHGGADISVHSNAKVTYKKESDKLWINFALTTDGQVRNNSGVGIVFDGTDGMSIELVNKLLDKGFTNVNMYGRIKAKLVNNTAYLKIKQDSNVNMAGPKNYSTSDEYYTVTVNIVKDKPVYYGFYCGNYFTIDATAEIYKIWASK